jgi:murein DD-endopeptidase MepM/ murein hydrolase activator NlpD
MAYNWRFPVDKVKLGSLFGLVDQWHKNPHRGIDYVAPEGTPIKACGDGKVVANEWSDGLGHVVIIQVGKWFFGSNHMVEKSPLAVGTAVKSGQVIGKVGNTGKFSAGAHLHQTLSLEPRGNFAGKVYCAHTFVTKMKAAEAKAKEVI